MISILAAAAGPAVWDPCRIGDSVGTYVLDRTQMQLSFCGAVFGDVGQPRPVRRGGGEVAADQIVVDRRAGLLLVAAAFLAEADVARLVGQEPITELRIVAVRVEQRVRPMSPLEFRDVTGLSRHR